MSDNAHTLFSQALKTLQSSSAQLRDRGHLNLRICRGTDLPMPPFTTASQLFDELEAWIQQHAHSTETIEIPLDSLTKPATIFPLFDTLWQCIQRFYRLHLQWVISSFS